MSESRNREQNKFGYLQIGEWVGGSGEGMWEEENKKKNKGSLGEAFL